MPPIRNRRTSATNTRSGGPVRPTRQTVPARVVPTPIPIVETVTRTPMEEVDIPNEGALQALKPEDNLDQVPANSFVKFKVV